MNLQKIKNPRSASGELIRTRCCRCGLSHTLDKMFADLDGPAFQAYYCTLCAILEKFPATAGKKES